MRLTLAAGPDTSRGGTGNDEVIGLAGDDQIFGDEGDDSLTGSGDNDTITGGAGHDSIHRQAQDGDRLGKRRGRPGRDHALALSATASA